MREQGLFSLRAAGSQVRRTVALLGGSMEELPLLRAARLASERNGASVEVCWTPASQASAARPLLIELARNAALEDLSCEAFTQLLDRGRLDALMLSPGLWRRHAGALWPRLHRASVYVCRQAVLPPTGVLCCADSYETAVGLMDRLTAVSLEPSTRVTLLRALPPPSPWVLGMMALSGYWVPPCTEEPLEPAEVAGVRELVIRAGATEAASAVFSARETSLLVLGWHQHSLPLPERWLHPIAWRLSTSFPSDVLLVPLGVQT